MFLKHYEVLLNGKQIDPYKLKMPEVKSLDDKSMIRYQETKNYLTNKVLELENFNN